MGFIFEKQVQHGPGPEAVVTSLKAVIFSRRIIYGAAGFILRTFVPLFFKTQMKNTVNINIGGQYYSVAHSKQVVDNAHVFVVEPIAGILPEGLEFEVSPRGEVNPKITDNVFAPKPTNDVMYGLAVYYHLTTSRPE